MLRFAGIATLFVALNSLAWAESFEIDRIKPHGDSGVLRVNSAGNIVDPDCRLMADEIARHIAQNRVSAPVNRSAITRHTQECNKVRETQYKRMEENQKRISEDRAREADEKAKGKEADRSACVDKCRETCSAACPPTTITGGTAASGIVTANGACPVTCPPRDVCEKRCAK